MSPRVPRSAVVLTATMLLAGGCTAEDAKASAAGSEQAGVTVCQVTDASGIDDRSFNQTANAGLVRAEEELGVQTKVLESDNEVDYESNISAFVGDGCDLVVTAGYLFDAVTQASAQENPEQLYAIVEVDFVDADTGEDVSYDNVGELAFATDEAAFLAGYAAAGTTRSGRVGTFGGMNIPTVVDFMDGFLAGVQQYNQDNGAAVEVLGWDGSDGLFTGGFEDPDAAKRTTKALADEGADIIMPVAGKSGLGAVAAAQEAVDDGLGLVWVDTDGCESVPDACSLFLTSVQKKSDNAVFDTIGAVVDGDFTGGLRTGTLENDGVGIADYHEWSSKVPQEVQDQVEAYRQKIIDGDQPVQPS